MDPSKSVYTLMFSNLKILSAEYNFFQHHLKYNIHNNVYIRKIVKILKKLIV